MIDVALTNQQSVLAIDAQLVENAARTVLQGEGIANARVSLAVVDDEVIHQLNRQFLSHDYATDVLSFLLEESNEGIDGEVIVSAETAIRSAGEYNWPAIHELLLYVVHGTLHLTGYDDHEEEERRQMRARETVYLQSLDISLPQDHLAS